MTIRRALFAGLDGKFRVEGLFESAEQAREYIDRVGSRWIFYPICFVVTEKAHKIVDVPNGFPKEWIGKTVKRTMQVIKENEHTAFEYIEGRSPFDIYP